MGIFQIFDRFFWERDIFQVDQIEKPLDKITKICYHVSRKGFWPKILLDILRPVAIRFLSRIVHGNCFFDELVNLKSVF